MTAPSLLKCLLVVSLLGTPGWAADKKRPAEQTEAQRAYERGVQLYRSGQYEEAVKAFQEAYRAQPHASLLFNIGQSYERLGDLEKALDSYRGYLAAAPKAEDRDAVEASIAALRQRIAESKIQLLKVTTAPPAARVSIDGTERGRSPLAERLPIGEHSVGVTLEGYQQAHRTVVLTQAAAVELDITLDPLPKPPKVWTYAALGTAGAALLAGGAFGFLAMQDSATLRDQSIRDQEAVQRLHDGAQSKALAANVLYGVGGALAATGGVLFFVEGRF